MQKTSQFAIGVVLFALAGFTPLSAQSVRQAEGLAVVRLAERGNARAQTRLGFMLATGRGAPQNDAEAAYWYQRAAEQGDPDAQYLLGICFDLAKGVALNWVQAYKWFNLSASRTVAGEEREHRLRMRDAIAKKLSRSELELAQSLALAWRPRPER
jgi:TPR repeat protein